MPTIKDTDFNKSCIHDTETNTVHKSNTSEQKTFIPQKQTLFTNPTPANIKQGNIDTNSIPPSHNINDKKH